MHVRVAHHVAEQRGDLGLLCASIMSASSDSVRRPRVPWRSRGREIPGHRVRHGRPPGIVSFCWTSHISRREADDRLYADGLLVSPAAHKGPRTPKPPSSIFVKTVAWASVVDARAGTTRPALARTRMPSCATWCSFTAGACDAVLYSLGLQNWSIATGERDESLKSAPYEARPNCLNSSAACRRASATPSPCVASHRRPDTG